MIPAGRKHTNFPSGFLLYSQALAGSYLARVTDLEEQLVPDQEGGADINDEGKEKLHIDYLETHFGPSFHELAKL